MKTFRVVVRRDAWVNYTADVQAADKITAAALAEQAWKTGNPSVHFEEDGLTEFDAVLVDPDECEEVEPEA